MLLEFVKMQGAGNDYLFFDGFEQEIKEPEKLARRLSVRAVSVGGDGIILILPPSVTGADARMRIFNADGSEAQMCGNGVRCAAKFLCEERGIGRDVLLIETLAGIRRVEVKREGGVVKRARVAMGRADFCLSHVTNSAEGEEMIHREVCVKSSRIRLSALSMGNPHAVSFWEEIEGLDLVHIGPAIEHHPLFSEGVNAEFVRVHSPTLLEVRVWERGSGETLACGTGACAAVAAAVRLGFCRMGTKVAVRLGGGKLWVEVFEDETYLEGPCESVYRGVVQL